MVEVNRFFSKNLYFTQIIVIKKKKTELKNNFNTKIIVQKYA